MEEKQKKKTSGYSKEWKQVIQALVDVRYVQNLLINADPPKDLPQSEILEKLDTAIEELEGAILSQGFEGLESEEERLQRLYTMKFGRNWEVIDKYRGRIKHDTLYRYGVIESDEGLFAVAWQDIGHRGKFPWKAVPITKEEHEEIKEDPEPHTRIIELLTEKDDIL